MKANAKKETIYVNIIMLAVFFFAFLGTEYLFDNCMMYVTDASGVVRAQNQMLGVSAIGFLLYNWISGFFADKSPWVTGGTGLLAFGIGAGCMGCIILHAGYVQMMIAGGVLFFLLGVVGAGVHYRMAYSVYDRAMLARCVGFAYAGGIFLQFLNNNMIHENHTQAVALCAGKSSVSGAGGWISHRRTIAGGCRTEGHTISCLRWDYADRNCFSPDDSIYNA